MYTLKKSAQKARNPCQSAPSPLRAGIPLSAGSGLCATKLHFRSAGPGDGPAWPVPVLCSIPPPSDLSVSVAKGVLPDVDSRTLDLSPEGMLEELLVQRIAICCWRQRRALECEAQLFQRQRLIPLGQAGLTIEKLDDACRDVDHVEGLEHKTFQEFLSCPLVMLWIKSCATKPPSTASWRLPATTWNGCSGRAKASTYRHQ